MPAITNRRGLLILICLLLVSASWGSCYLFIELALRSFPPFLLTATRLGCAGLILFAGLWFLGHRAVPTRRDLKFAFTTAFFMSVLSAGLMTVGQQYVPSGTVAQREAVVIDLKAKANHCSIQFLISVFPGPS